MSRAYFCTQFDGEEISQLLHSWKENSPRAGMIAMVSEQQVGSLPTLQALSRDHDFPLLGGIFPAIIWQQQFHRDGILLIKQDEMPEYIITSDLASDEATLREQISSLSREITQHLTHGSDHTLCLIFDGMLPNIASMLDELYLNIANQVEYTGVNAGSETFQPINCIFDQQQFTRNALLSVILPSRVNSALEHGYTPPGEMITATSTEGNRIINIDWQPAFEKYQQKVSEQFQVVINQENFYQYGVHFPFGIIRGNGEIQVRIPVALNDDNSLFCVGEVPPNSLLALLDAPTKDSRQTVEALTRDLGEIKDEPMVLFYCAGRCMHMGEEAAQSELTLLRETLGVDLYGALSLGEIGSSQQGGYPLFHNAALTCCQI